VGGKGWGGQCKAYSKTGDLKLSEEDASPEDLRPWRTTWNVVGSEPKLPWAVLRGPLIANYPNFCV
jgi:hypothetical protein